MLNNRLLGYRKRPIAPKGTDITDNSTNFVAKATTINPEKIKF